MRVIPTIMESEEKVVESKLLILRKQNEMSVQFDIGDGMFSEWVGVSPDDLMDLDTKGLAVELHLMVDDPVEWVAECGKLSPYRIIGQIEHMGSQEYFLQEVESNGGGAKGGLALELDTQIEAIEEAVLKRCEVVLLLSVPTGTSGSKFDERVLGKIRELRKIYKGKILIDGGINEATIKLVEEAGADEVTVNSYYWRKINEQNTEA